MDGFEQLLLDFKNLSQNKSQQGTFFELLMKKYFLTRVCFKTQHLCAKRQCSKLRI